jgi:FkbM family methyltransferase
MQKVMNQIKNIIPPNWVYLLTHIKKMLSPNGFLIKTYSGDGEDIILNKYLFKNKNDGFYVDVGSFHPKYISNTYLLHKRGWKGINIDPNPEAQRLFNIYRPNDTNLMTGVANEETELTYYSFSHAGINTFDKELALAKQKKAWNKLLETRNIPCVPLSVLFSKHVPSETHIDILDIDVEGMDLDVLKSNDWNKYVPSTILVEDRAFREKMTESETFKFLQKHGYEFYAYMNITLIMINKSKFL